MRSFFQGPQDELTSPLEDTDSEYCQRLLAVYQELDKAGQLVAPLPEWVTAPSSAEDLRANPRVQAVLAACTAYTPSKWLLERELSQRKRNDNAELSSWEETGSEDVYDAAAREELAGLCFSGGGIRSATFCLGVMQALAEAGKLDKFDYLSTVSGGGYIHQWLASWIMRESGRMKKVQEKLVPLPAAASPARAPEQIFWLRRYSSYLTPRRGILSADTWTMIATWFRNTFLNQIVLFSFLAACLLAMRALTYPFITPGLVEISGPAETGTAAAAPVLRWVMGLGLLFLVATSIYLAFSMLWGALASVTAKFKPGEEDLNALGDREVVTYIVIPSFVLSVVVALESLGRISVFPIGHYPILLGGLFLYVLGIVLAATFGGQAPEALKSLSGRKRTGWFSMAMIASAILCTVIAIAPAVYLADLPGGPDRIRNGPVRIRQLTDNVEGFIDRAMHKESTSVTVRQEVLAQGDSVSHFDIHVSGEKEAAALYLGDTPDRLIAVFAPVFFLSLQFLAIRLQLGMIGRFYTESRREWLARFGGWSAIVCAAWMLLSGIAVLGPQICGWFSKESTLRWLWGGLSVLAAHAVTLYAGGSGKSDGKPKPGTFLGYSVLDLIGMVGAPLCVLSLLVIVSGLVDNVLQRTGGSAGYTLLFTAAVVVTFVLSGWRVDVNEFSMHGFYRNRLARCYLGATDRSRVPDPFTHFDEHETGVRKGIAVSELLPAKFGGKPRTVEGMPGGEEPAYDGPFPIFCSTINLTFGEDLGWQERKGASFAFTPFYSGYHVGWTGEKGRNPDTSFNGYVPTKNYAYPDLGIALSTVAAISGAALSPNQGYSSTPALAFLMTLFNVRLGWWLANPRKPKIWPSRENKPTPRFGPRYLLNELLGLSDDTSNYVCLCDGGRFENMGLYELVRRRCKHIVICDAEQDTEMVFEGIGNAIARCRTDFGAEIKLDLHPLIPDPDTGLSAQHFRVGTIRYPAPPGAQPGERFGRKYEGTIVYLKSTVVGDETGDLLHHKRACPDFPQDSTLNQWFIESQFESYRRLGQLIGEKASGSIRLRG
jgi:hypothetical protein